MSTRAQRLPHLTIGLLGLVTIAAYGAWYYAFGVLLDPILSDTGWPEGLVAATYSASTALGALGSVPAGRLIDRVGSRPAFAVAAVAASVGLVGASYAADPARFALGAVVGGASLQAFGFYHVTQTTAVRSAPDRPARAIAVLTIYGAFSSPIYLPLAATLVEATDWRTTLRLLALSTAMVLAVAAVAIRPPPAGGADGRATAEDRRREPAAGWSAVTRSGPARRYLVATSCIGLAVGLVLVYQVPLMVGAGLPLATAAWMAGARGSAQLLGRLPLGWLLDRIEARAAVRLAFAAVTVGVAILAFAGNVAVALLYVVVAGFGIGATSPLQGIYADELFDREHLGASMGLLTMVFGLSTAVGPAVVGIVAGTVGSRWWGIVVAVVAGSVAVAALGPTTIRLPAAVPRDDGGGEVPRVREVNEGTPGS